MGGVLIGRLSASRWTAVKGSASPTPRCGIDGFEPPSKKPRCRMAMRSARLWRPLVGLVLRADNVVADTWGATTARQHLCLCTMRCTNLRRGASRVELYRLPWLATRADGPNAQRFAAPVSASVRSGDDDGGWNAASVRYSGDYRLKPWRLIVARLGRASLVATAQGCPGDGAP